MSKGVNALELIFSMFILIIITLIIVRMFVTNMNTGQIEKPVADIKETYNYQNQKNLCDQKCSAYTSGGCVKEDAVNYCLQQVSLDIDGNKNPGETGHGNFVANIPYCEDGLYCFHFFPCNCGTYKLSDRECLSILCEYYKDKGFTAQESMDMIKNGQQPISAGTCEKDVNKWKLKYPLSEPMKKLRADRWWVMAGYSSSSCDNIVYSGSTASTATFSCVNSHDTVISCTWSEGPTSGTATVSLDGVSVPGCVDNMAPSSGSCDLTTPDAGTYTARLTFINNDGTGYSTKTAQVTVG